MTRRRLILLVLVVTALLAIVALAAGGRPLGASAERGAGLPTVFWDYVFTTFIILFVIAAVVSIVARFLFIRDLAGQRPKTSQGRTARTIAIVLAVCVVVAFIGRHLNLRRLHVPRPPGATTTSTTLTPPPKGQDTTPADAARVHFQWPELVVILGVLLVLGGLVATRRRLSDRPALGWWQGAPEVLAAALDESLDDLRAEPDLRRAIVAAYARMEVALGAAGLPRRPAEAPLEYVERALLALDTSAAAVRRLTDLFEWARFSQHEPEPAMRDEAIAALVAVRDELRASERVPA